MAPRHAARADADLFLVGAGVSSPLHLTLQTIEVLTACARICTNLREEQCALLPKVIRDKCDSLWPLYEDNRDRAANYHDVANAVLKAAERRRPIAWLTPGHPLVFDSVSQALLKAGRSRGWRVAVVPAISCLDTILAELGYDPASGLMVCETTSLVRGRRALVPAIATALLQPSAFGSDVAHLDGRWRPDLGPLRDYLLDWYDPEHPCAFVSSSSSRSRPSHVFWTQLRALDDVPGHFLAAATLFVPAVAASSEGAHAKPRSRRSDSRRRTRQP